MQSEVGKLKPVLCILGPTASGKTALSLELAERFPCEIISVDSGMIYRGMDIGTAKPSLDERAGVPHHFIDIIDPPESFSAAAFCQQTNCLIEAIYHRGKLPLLVGGTMMYYRALQQGLAELPQADAAVRASLLEKVASIGLEGLYRELAVVDPHYAAQIHPHDSQRIQRALEVFYLTGKPLSDFVLRTPSSMHYNFINIGLFPQNRQWLHQRIAQRWTVMLAQNFLDEVTQLLKTWHLTLSMPALRCVGYRQAHAYLTGNISYVDFVEQGLAATRQLAKRQLTWLRTWPEIQYIDCEKLTEFTKVIAIIEKICNDSIL